MSARVIRVLVADDEPLARRGICMRLAREPDMTVVGEAEDGPQAVTALRSLSPDVVFLDIRMPGLDGFEVLARIDPATLPVVVFVSAHRDRALQAFEIHALDYLLKPYTEERFRECLRHLREVIARGDPRENRARVDEMLHEHGDGTYARRFAIREGDRIVFLKATDLQAVEAAGNYVMLVGDGGRHLLRLTLSEMEGRLDPAHFARIHRSTIVGRDHVKEVLPDAHGDGDVVLAGGARYRMSRSYRARLLPGSLPGG